MRQAAAIGAHKIMALLLGDGGQEAFPQIGEEPRGAVLIIPVDLALADGEDAAQDEPARALGMRFGIGQRQRRSP